MDYLQSIFSEVTVMAPSMGAIFAGILAALLLVFSGFASGSEIAFFSLTPNDLNELEESNNERDKQILALGEDSERTLATILITNNLVNVAIIMLCTYFINHIINFGNAAWWLEFVVITVLLTFLLLLFGEIIPKVYCGQHTLAMCRRFCGGITILRKLFYPVSSVLIRSGIWASRVVQKESHVLSVPEALLPRHGAGLLPHPMADPGNTCLWRDERTHFRDIRRLRNPEIVCERRTGVQTFRIVLPGAWQLGRQRIRNRPDHRGERYPVSDRDQTGHKCKSNGNSGIPDLG